VWIGGHYYTVDGSLDRGYNMAKLSMVVDAQGRAEIWPIVLEKAFAMSYGGYEQLGQGGLPFKPGEALVGFKPGGSPSVCPAPGRGGAIPGSLGGEMVVGER
jgi:hypothetical protein